MKIEITLPEDIEFILNEMGEEGRILIREILSERLGDLFILKSLAEKSNLTEEESIELGRFINQKLAKRYKKLIE